MTCFIAQNLLSEYIDGDLQPDRLRELETHLAGCDDCSEELQRTRSLRHMLRALPIERAPVGFVDRVNDRVKSRSPLRRFASWLGEMSRRPAVAVGAVAGVLVVMAIGVTMRGGLVQFEDLMTPAKRAPMQGATTVDGVPADQAPEEGRVAGKAENGKVVSEDAPADGELRDKVSDNNKEQKATRQESATRDSSVAKRAVQPAPTRTPAATRTPARAAYRATPQSTPAAGAKVRAAARPDSESQLDLAKSKASSGEARTADRKDDGRLRFESGSEDASAGDSSGDVGFADSAGSDAGGAGGDTADYFADDELDAGAAPAVDETSKTVAVEAESSRNRTARRSPASRSGKKSGGLFSKLRRKNEERQAQESPAAPAGSLEESAPSFDTDESLLANEPAPAKEKPEETRVTGSVASSSEVDADDGAEAAAGVPASRGAAGRETSAGPSGKKAEKSNTSASDDRLTIEGTQYRVRASELDAPARLVEAAKALGGKEALWPSGPPPLDPEGKFTVLQIELPADKLDEFRAKVAEIAISERLLGAPSSDSETVLLRISINYQEN